MLLFSFDYCILDLSLKLSLTQGLVIGIEVIHVTVSVGSLVFIFGSVRFAITS